MRVHTHTLVIVAGLGAAIAGFWGCGGDITTATGSATGSGGSGGHATTGTGPGTTGPTSSSVTTVASSAASSSSGGNTPCDMACAHIQMCTGFSCSIVGINCATMGSQYDCEFTCAANTPCADLGQGTIQTCQAQCAGDGGPTDGGPGDGGSPMQCQTCAGSKCTSQLQACGTDMSAGGCAAWLQCTGACFQAANPTVCEASCDSQFPNAKPKYDPVYSCTCTNCMSECSGANPCAHGTDGGP